MSYDSLTLSAGSALRATPPPPGSPCSSCVAGVMCQAARARASAAPRVGPCRVQVCPLKGLARLRNGGS